MSHAIFIAEQPEPGTGHKAGQAWQNFVASAHNAAAKAKGAVRITDGCYEVDLSVSTRPLADLVKCAADWGVRSRTLFLKKPPAWSIGEADK